MPAILERGAGSHHYKKGHQIRQNLSRFFPMPEYPNSGIKKSFLPSSMMNYNYDACEDYQCN
jgi:hypothetical protein